MVDTGFVRVAFISIHPPREGWDASWTIVQVLPAPFQSTHPVRGGTVFPSLGYKFTLFQSTHPVRGGTASADSRRSTKKFQSTHPVRGGTAAMP